MFTKIVQTERNTKEKYVFLWISEVKPIFDEVNDTNKRAKCKRKVHFSFHFRAKVSSTKSKIRISERKCNFPSESIFDEVKDRYTSNSNEMVSLNSSIACGNLGQFSREKIATKFICPSILPSAVCI